LIEWKSPDNLWKFFMNRYSFLETVFSRKDDISEVLNQNSHLYRKWDVNLTDVWVLCDCNYFGANIVRYVYL